MPQCQVKELMNRFELEQAVVTCGEDGAWQVNRHGRKVEAGANTSITSPVDTVGAGDGLPPCSYWDHCCAGPSAVTLERANAFAAAICEIAGRFRTMRTSMNRYTREWGI